MGILLSNEKELSNKKERANDTHNNIEEYTLYDFI